MDNANNSKKNRGNEDAKSDSDENLAQPSPPIVNAKGPVTAIAFRKETCASKRISSRKSITRTKQPVGMPKRPLPPYSIFFRQQSSLVLEDSKERATREGSNLFGVTAQIIGERWRNLSRDEVDHYRHLADLDADRYRREMVEYQGQQQSKKCTASQNNEKSGRPMSCDSMPIQQSFPLPSIAETMSASPAVDLSATAPASSVARLPPPVAAKVHRKPAANEHSKPAAAHHLSEPSMPQHRHGINRDMQSASVDDFVTDINRPGAVPGTYATRPNPPAQFPIAHSDATTPTSARQCAPSTNNPTIEQLEMFSQILNDLRPQQSATQTLQSGQPGLTASGGIERSSLQLPHPLQHALEHAVEQQRLQQSTSRNSQRRYDSTREAAIAVTACPTDDQYSTTLGNMLGNSITPAVRAAARTRGPSHSTTVSQVRQDISCVHSEHVQQQWQQVLAALLDALCQSSQEKQLANWRPQR